MYTYHCKLHVTAPRLTINELRNSDEFPREWRRYTCRCKIHEIISQEHVLTDVSWHILQRSVQILDVATYVFTCRVVLNVFAKRDIRWQPTIKLV